MIANEIDDNPALQKVLWACDEYWRRIEQPEDERLLCYSWVSRVHETNFALRSLTSSCVVWRSLDFSSRRVPRGVNKGVM